MILIAMLRLRVLETRGLGVSGHASLLQCATLAGPSPLRGEGISAAPPSKVMDFLGGGAAEIREWRALAAGRVSSERRCWIRIVSAEFHSIVGDRSQRQC